MAKAVHTPKPSAAPPPPADTAGCGSCRYWRAYEAGSDLGRCHRYPAGGPSVVVTTRAGPVYALPVKTVIDWCGEYAA